MDLITTTIILMGVLIPIAFVVGRFLDPVWKAKQLRKLLKKNFILLGIVSEDGKTIDMKVVNPEGGVIKVEDKFWIMDKGRIYRKDKPEAGFFIGGNQTKYEEGVPTIYVSSRDIKPIDFIKTESKVKPEAIGSLLMAWVANQSAKGLFKDKKMQIILLITAFSLLASVACALLIFSALEDISEINAKLDQIKQNQRVSIPSSNDGGVILPNQPK